MFAASSRGEVIFIFLKTRLSLLRQASFKWAQPGLAKERKDASPNMKEETGRSKHHQLVFGG